MEMALREGNEGLSLELQRETRGKVETWPSFELRSRESQ